ncbi:MAG: phosphatidylglycerophosphatase A, partial [Candidatus Hydrogenedentota bacterium]
MIFRVLDIIKCYPMNKMERFKGGLGVVMDDIIAGILTSIIIVIRQLLPLASCFVRYLSFPLR